MEYWLSLSHFSIYNNYNVYGNIDGIASVGSTDTCSESSQRMSNEDVTQKTPASVQRVLQGNMCTPNIVEADHVE